MVRNALGLSLVCLLALAPAGCVERSFTLTSNPPGALVMLSSEEIGRTPVTIPFTWYGDYEVILRLEGYETLKTHHNLKPPVYEVFPLDFFSEIAPWTYRDRRSAHFELTKRTPPSDETLMQRADELRLRAVGPEGK
jgi:hypothetical protein